MIEEILVSLGSFENLFDYFSGGFIYSFFPSRRRVLFRILNYMQKVASRGLLDSEKCTSSLRQIRPSKHPNEGSRPETLPNSPTSDDPVSLLLYKTINHSRHHSKPNIILPINQTLSSQSELPPPKQTQFPSTFASSTQGIVLGRWFGSKLHSHRHGFIPLGSDEF